MKTLTIACLGDSLTHGYGVRREASWVSLANLELAPDIVLLNHGRNGDTTSGMLFRLEREVLPAQPNAVLLMGGANDIAYDGGTAPARTNMPVMVRQAADAGVTPLVGIPLPYIPEPREEWGSFEELVQAAAAYDSYALWLREFCVSSGLRSVDFRARFEEDVKRTRAAPGSYFFDGLHFNPKGHRLLAARMVESARELWAED